MGNQNSHHHTVYLGKRQYQCHESVRKDVPPDLWFNRCVSLFVPLWAEGGIEGRVGLHVRPKSLIGKFGWEKYITGRGKCQVLRDLKQGPYVPTQSPIAWALGCTSPGSHQELGSPGQYGVPSSGWSHQSDFKAKRGERFVPSPT